MIPMSVGYKNIRVYGAVFVIVPHDLVSQWSYTGSQIDDQKPFISADFQAGCIAAEFHSTVPRTGD
jgi:hypothetical protein